MASTRSSSQALWTISIALRRCSELRSFYPWEIILHPTHSTCWVVLYVVPLHRLCRVHPHWAQAHWQDAADYSQVLWEYFSCSRLSNGTLKKKCKDQLCFAAKHKLCHELKECYKEKLKKLSESQEHQYSCSWCCEPNSRSTHVSRSTCDGDCHCFEACCPTTRTLVATARPLPRTASSTSHAIYMVLTGSIPYNKCHQNPK